MISSDEFVSQAEPGRRGAASGPVFPSGVMRRLSFSMPRLMALSIGCAAGFASSCSGTVKWEDKRNSLFCLASGRITLYPEPFASLLQ